MIGAKRLIEPFSHAPTVISYRPEEIRAVVEQTDKEEIVIVMSGDTGFYSGTKKLLQYLEEWEVKIYPGISSISYLSAQIGISWEDAKILSLHGREENLEEALFQYDKVFLLTAGKMNELCQRLTSHGFGDYDIYIGEWLSYPQERITIGKVREMQQLESNPLACCFLIANGEKNLIEEYMKKSVELILFIGLPMIFGLMAISENFSVSFLGEDFRKSGDIMFLLSPTILFISIANVIRTQYLIPNEKDKEYVIATICGAIVNLIFNIILIPKLGSIGACIGTLLAEFTVMLYQIILVRKKIQICAYLKNGIRFLVTSLLMFIIVFSLNFLNIKNIILLLIIQIVVGIIIYGIFNINYRAQSQQLAGTYALEYAGYNASDDKLQRQLEAQLTDLSNITLYDSKVAEPYYIKFKNF